MDKERKYTVWVGGTEVNDYLLTLDDAIELANRFSVRGYSDVKLDKYQ